MHSVIPGLYSVNSISFRCVLCLELSKFIEFMLISLENSVYLNYRIILSIIWFASHL